MNRLLDQSQRLFDFLTIGNEILNVNQSNECLLQAHYTSQSNGSLIQAHYTNQSNGSLIQAHYTNQSNAHTHLPLPQ